MSLDLHVFDCFLNADSIGRKSSSAASTATTRPSLPPTPPPPEPPAAYEAERFQLPEDGLIDLEESEGRKRGSELMMMLGGFGAAAPAKEAPPPPPAPVGVRPARGPLLATAAPFQPRGATATRGAQLLARGAAERTRQSTQQAAAKVLESRYLGIVREAALEAFGDDVAHVEGDLSGGFNVQLSERSRHCSAKERLEELGRELWPRLPCDSVVALEPGSIGKRAWLTMHYVLAAPPDGCWDYAGAGCCPRGALCRWPHALPQSLTVDIEVAR
ncbi:unnamed protein product [Prorocentrum cordatum]|uniref:C3H1-type domain-containing protein n=1 Tax=Prorocentrum cordatum TaxID=2364126 RepID=A0ABN9W098_9DINO|nr:unnamed protein product [Polarella glacialis]